jgi:hypothetical protein
MAHQNTESLTSYPKFWGKWDEDVQRHWFLCEAIWWSHGTLDANKLVYFHAMIRGQTLKWYMKSIEPGNPKGKPFPLPQVNFFFIVEFKLPQSKKQAILELWEIKKKDGELPESITKYLNMKYENYPIPFMKTTSGNGSFREIYH